MKCFKKTKYPCEDIKFNIPLFCFPIFNTSLANFFSEITYKGLSSGGYGNLRIFLKDRIKNHSGKEQPRKQNLQQTALIILKGRTLFTEGKATS